MATDHEVKRATGLLVIEARSSNPNGDPDQESDPRTRPDGRGLISPVSFKRKLRDLVHEREGPVWKALATRLALGAGGDDYEYRILETRGRIRADIEVQLKDGSFERLYWDGRVFGNTFLEEQASTWIKTGVVQFGLGVSVAPVSILRLTNTSKAGVQEGKDRGMAPLGFRVVEHGVYCMPFSVNPTAAPKSGCRRLDIELLKALVPYAYPHTASAARPFVEIRHGWYIEHPNRLGSWPQGAILDALAPRKKGDSEEPSVQWGDYDVPTASALEPIGVPSSAVQDLALLTDA